MLSEVCSGESGSKIQYCKRKVRDGKVLVFLSSVFYRIRGRSYSLASGSSIRHDRVMSQYKILFVCLGNICRSPAGENVMRDLLLERQRQGIVVDSAGTAGYHIGKAPDARMTAELQSRGIRVSGRAQQFQKAHFQEFDLIIPMDASNTKNILKLAKTEVERAKVKPFMSFCSSFTNDEVPDPYYGGPEGFTLVADLMVEGCSGILKYVEGVEEGK